MQDKIIKKRYDQIDILRGLFFIPMFIFHLFSVYDLTKNFTTKLTSNNILKFFGYVRNLYIILAGYSLYLSWESYQENIKINKQESTIFGFIKYRLARSTTIAFHALLITILSHLLFPSYGIKFGILHFIALGTLIISPVATFNNSNITFLFSVIWLYITNNNLIPMSNPVVNTITGKFFHYSAADYFPLNKNLILLIIGLFLGQTIHPKLKSMTSNNIFKFIGQNSLELYTSHFIIIMIIYWTLNKLN
jgi:uncharacterized membrane protein